MKEPRVQFLVNELEETVDRLNRIEDMLTKTGTTFYLGRSANSGPFKLDSIRQNVEYRRDV
jgi:hypothetical protein